MKAFDVALASAPEPADTVEERAAHADSPRDRGLGASLADATAGDGALVEHVDPDGPSDERLAAGDVLLEVDGRRVRKAADVHAAVRAKPRPSTLVVRLRRGAAFLFAAVPLGPGKAP